MTPLNRKMALKQQLSQKRKTVYRLIFAPLRRFCAFAVLLGFLTVF